MEQRIEKELELLKQFFPDIEYHSNEHWFYIPSYPLLDGWNRTSIEIAFQIKKGYPGTKPYAFYVPVGLRFNDEKPKNYKEPAKNQPPFDGEWGCISWSVTNEWRPTANLKSGSNLLNWVNSFKDRFQEGV